MAMLPTGEGGNETTITAGRLSKKSVIRGGANAQS
jgi:hypothetical protein